MFRDKKSGRLSLSPTDLAAFLSCRHRTALEMGRAAGKRERPVDDDPGLAALFERGLEHEAAYVARLKAEGRTIVAIEGDDDPAERLARTAAAMREGADVIVQGALGNGRWFGYADVLLRVQTPSALGGWSYEVADTKLSRETKAGTVLQLLLYCTLLEMSQALQPEHFYVVTPDGAEQYRVSDYAAYFRLVRDQLDRAAAEDDDELAAANYPEPVDQCDVCSWTAQCIVQRRKDDHLSFVAGISRSQRRELTAHAIATTAGLAAMPIAPMLFAPRRGAPESYVRVREQARLQVETRDTGKTVTEWLPIVLASDTEPAQGLARLPEPTPGDLFLDLEGDPFAGPSTGPPVLRGREYLFGVVAADGSYRAFWAENEAAEKAAFEQLVDLITAAKREHPGMHVFHYAAYEPSAFKRLMGRHATRELEIDGFLRSETFVDLYSVIRHGLRAGIERYSIKSLETLYGFRRDVDLRSARINLQLMERAVELGLMAELKADVKAAVEGYNRDDCVSTLRLRDWLEAQRQRMIDGGAEIPRPAMKAAEASEPLKERQAAVAALRGQLLGEPDEARYLVAYLLDYHPREGKAEWWDYFRMIGLTDQELLDEPGAVSGLQYVGDVGREKRSVIQRYAYPAQEIELRRGDNLKLKDQSKWAEVVSIDRLARTIDVKVGPTKMASRPTAAFAHDHVTTTILEKALFGIGEGFVAGTADPLAVRLLSRVPPTTRNPVELGSEVLAIQGPPGAGKTYTGGAMICDLVAAGKSVGIAATGHKVIRNLLDAVAREAGRRGLTVTLAHKGGGDGSDSDGERPAVINVDENPDALSLLTSGRANVLGGTAWLWSRPEFAKSVDVLFIDEAGQVSLANALAMTQGAKSLVLLGDPQQLDQPTKGTHPPGIDVSVLEHILNGAKTMPEAQGMFLAETWRFGTPICRFTSEVFYEGKLRPTPRRHLDRQRLSGGPIEGGGLFVIDVSHEGNRNGSDEEIDVIAALVARLLAPGSSWTDHEGVVRQLTSDDIRVVSPYNVQVSRLQERLATTGVRVGTVDKFQGQEAPVAIYSMGTSTPEDAPRGMEFLYSLNRLNVATSRAQCAAIIVASPKLFEPECRTPRQVQLANALCRFRELSSALVL
jgi:uncharacterized protein